MDLTVHPEQILIMFVVFMASVTVLNVFVFRPTLVLLQERAKRLSGLAAEAKSLEVQCAAKFDAYNKKMEEARNAARAAREDILKSADTEQKQLLSKARTKAEAAIASAKNALVSEASESREKLKQVASDLSKTMVEKILKRKVA
jgi:F0F1-type ATP synthase membrane subunit b/b'